MGNEAFVAEIRVAGMGVDASGNQVQLFTKMHATQLCFLYRFPVLKQRTEHKIANCKSVYLPFDGFDLASKKGKEKGERNAFKSKRDMQHVCLYYISRIYNKLLQVMLTALVFLAHGSEF